MILESGRKGNKMAEYGYVRVSSKDQNEDRQMIAMENAGIERKKIYIDKQSGKDFERPKYKKLINKLKTKDVLFVKSIDRLGRNYDEIIRQWQYLTKDKNVDIVVLDFPLLDTRNQLNGLTGKFLSDMVLQILSYVAQIERENIRQRQAEGIEAAKRKGVKFGREELEVPKGFKEVYERWTSEEVSLREAARTLNVDRKTFKKWGERII